MRVSPIVAGVFGAAVLGVGVLLLSPIKLYAKQSPTALALYEISKAKNTLAESQDEQRHVVRQIETLSRLQIPEVNKTVLDVKDQTENVLLNQDTVSTSLDKIASQLRYREPIVPWTEPLSTGGISLTIFSVIAFCVELFFLLTRKTLISNRVWDAVAGYAPIAWFGGMLTITVFYGVVAGVDFHGWFRFLLATWLIVLTHFFWQAETVYRRSPETP